MKKIFLILILATGSCKLSAQMTFSNPVWSEARPQAIFQVDTNSQLIVNGVVLRGIGVNNLTLTPYTVTNSTDWSFGFGPGVICVDSNYIYVSVGANRWKRSALSTW